MTKTYNRTLTYDQAQALLKHLRRAGHNQLGESHKVYPSPGTWDIEMDKPGCIHGLWFLPEGVSDDDEGSEYVEREQQDECNCGYGAALAFLEAVT